MTLNFLALQRRGTAGGCGGRAQERLLNAYENDFASRLQPQGYSNNEELEC